MSSSPWGIWSNSSSGSTPSALPTKAPTSPVAGHASSAGPIHQHAKSPFVSESNLGEPSSTHQVTYQGAFTNQDDWNRSMNNPPSPWDVDDLGGPLRRNSALSEMSGPTLTGRPGGGSTTGSRLDEYLSNNGSIFDGDRSRHLSFSNEAELPHFFRSSGVGGSAPGSILGGGGGPGSVAGSITSPRFSKTQPAPFSIGSSILERFSSVAEATKEAEILASLSLNGNSPVNGSLQVKSPVVSAVAPAAIGSYNSPSPKYNTPPLAGSSLNVQNVWQPVNIPAATHSARLLDQDPSDYLGSSDNIEPYDYSLAAVNSTPFYGASKPGPTRLQQPTSAQTQTSSRQPSFAKKGGPRPLAKPFIPSAGLRFDPSASAHTRTSSQSSSGNVTPDISAGANSNHTSHHNNPRRSALLEEFRSPHKNKKYELTDLYGHLVEFSGDQHGSRFIQQKLETSSAEDKSAVFDEIQSQSLQLMTDVFGNYVIQKYFELGTPVQRTVLVKQMESHILSLSLHMYGCRVVQKAIEHVNTDQQCALVAELNGHILKCVKDQNGNHVIQKAIERIPPKRIGFIIDSFHQQVYQLATHPYGCRVIQRLLEHCDEEAQTSILAELHVFTFYLVEDQYGNYVIQHVIQKGRAEDREKITTIVRGSVLSFSRHKFASNVVEACIVYGTNEQRDLFIDEILKPRADGSIPLTVMMKDQFANYVIQKLLDVTHGPQHDRLVASIRPHLQTLKKFSYGKHLVSIEKLVMHD